MNKSKKRFGVRNPGLAVICYLMAGVCGLGGLIGASKIPDLKLEFIIGGLMSVLIWLVFAKILVLLNLIAVELIATKDRQ